MIFIRGRQGMIKFLNHNFIYLSCICFIGIFFITYTYADISKLTIDPPPASATDTDSIIDPTINYHSYFNTNIKLSDPISIMYLSWGNPQLDPFSPLSQINNLYEQPSNVALALSSDALFYPNPFSLKTDTPQIGFKTTKDVDSQSIEIQIFDMRGLQVFQAYFQDNIIGNTYNKFDFSESTFGKSIPNLSSGVYLFLILSDGIEEKILGKGKFSIKP
tara:strand:- start:3870 stop:4523 length:654 start_codon:yes stop_codon:yes gene_type:complete